MGISALRRKSGNSVKSSTSNISGTTGKAGISSNTVKSVKSSMSSKSDKPNNSKVNGRVIGNPFSRLKPTGLNYDSIIPTGAKTSKTKAMKEFVMQGKPYAYFITLTFARSLDIHECCSFIGKLIDKLNKAVFGRKYFDGPDYITGFAIVEPHKLGNARCDIHIHFLVRQHPKYDEYNVEEFKEKLHAAALTVHDGKKSVFDVKGIHIRDVWDDGAIGYCFKDIWDKNLSNVKILGKDGLSDSDDGQ
ncbi:MAG: hypothetical protein M0023_16550 [Desulfobacteraceae bacterium]|nr:hypothetical protein [Desulfobacteraceae bacterium]